MRVGRELFGRWVKEVPRSCTSNLYYYYSPEVSDSRSRRLIGVGVFAVVRDWDIIKTQCKLVQDTTEAIVSSTEYDKVSWEHKVI